MKVERKAKPACTWRTRSGRVLRAALYVKLALVFAVLVLGLGVLVRLLAGPVSMGDYQTRVADGIAARLGPGWSVSLGDTAVQLNGFRPAVSATELEIRNPGGIPVVRSPYALVTLDPLSLVTGGLAPREIELRDLQIRALIAADGSLSFLPASDAAALPTAGVEPPSVANDPPAGPRPSAVATALASLINPIVDPDSLIGGIDKASLVNARLTLVGPDGRERVGFDRVSAVFGHRGGGGRAIDLDLDGPRGAWHVGGLVRDEGERRRADLTATDVPIEDAMLLSGLSGLQGGSDLRLSATLSAELAGPRPATLRTRFESTRGRVALPGQPAIAIDHASGEAVWDEERRVLVLPALNLRSGRTDVTMSGELVAHEGGVGELTLAGRDAKFSGAAEGDAPFSVANIAATVRFGPQGIAIERLSLAGEGLDLAISGETFQTPAGTGLKANVRADGSGVRRLLRLWPEFINPELRGYLVTNLRSGTVEALRIAANLDAEELRHATSARPISDGALSMSFVMTGARLHVNDGMPDLSRLSVEGTASGTKTSLVARQGRLELPEGRRLNFLDGAYNQVDLDKPGSAAKVSFRLEGGADALVAFLRQPMFRDVSGLDLNPANVKGRADLKISFPLDPHRVPPPSEMPVVIGGTLSDLALDKVFGREKLENANLAVAYDLNGLSLRGEGRLGGSPAAIDLRQPRGGAGEVAVSLVLDEAARARRSLPVAPLLAGQVPVKILLPLGGGRAPIRVEADLSRAAIDGLLPGLTKPAGRPARLTFSTGEGETTDLRDIAFDAGPTQIRGSAVFGQDGTLEKADLPVLKIVQGEDLRAQVDRQGGVYKVALRGNVADARPILRWMSAAPAGGSSAKGRDGLDFDLDLGVNILTGNNDETLTGVTAKISSRNREIRALQFRGQFRQAPFEAQIRREAGPPVIVVSSADAGATLRFLDLYKRMLGGTLAVQATLGDNSQAGAVTIERFTLKNEPALRRIAAQHVPTGEGDDRAGSRLTELESDQVQFAKLTGGFRRTASRVEYKDVVVYGAQVGFNLSGFVDYARDRTDIQGTFVPAYGLNNAFSQVPIVGMILGGNKNEGLFAIDFRVSGPASSPSLTVNPLTVVAPGILRKLFGWAMPDADEPATTSSPRRRED